MQALTDNGKILEAYLNTELGLSVSVDLPVNYIAVVEAFGSKRADVAIINTFGYILAHDKYGVEAKLKLMNRGRDEYYGQIITRTDSKIKSIPDLDGKKFAFVDPASTSGYLLPLKLFKEEKVKIKADISIKKLAQIKSEIAESVIKSPADGTVVISKVWSDKGLEKVKIGDSINKGKPFISG